MQLCAFSARPLTHVELSRLAFRLASRAAISDLETNAVAVDAADGQRWYDTRPMLDLREVPAEFVDMHREALAYMEESGLILADRAAPHMVRVLRRD